MKIKSWHVVSLVLLSLSLFANTGSASKLFSLSKAVVFTHAGEVHEASRVDHAQELLGDSYIGSAAQRAEGKKSLHQVIQKKVYDSLKPRWKAHAKKIALAIINESTRKKMDPFFVLAVIKTESKFNPIARGLHGEIGLMQIKPSTAEWIAKKYKINWQGSHSLRDPSINIQIGVAYLDYLRGKFNKRALKYVSAYNVGPLKAKKISAPRKSKESYVTRVFDNYAEMYKSQNLVALN